MIAPSGQRSAAAMSGEVPSINQVRAYQRTTDDGSEDSGDLSRGESAGNDHYSKFETFRAAASSAKGMSVSRSRT